jgi:hypothetical protein
MLKEGLGLNLHSIRNYLDTEERFTDVREKLKEMGYTKAGKSASYPGKGY